MDRVKVEQLFVRQEIVSTLKDIRDLNVNKLTKDIEAIENGEDIAKVMNVDNSEFSKDLAFLRSVLKLLLLCIDGGVEKSLNDFLDTVKKTLGTNAYDELKEYVDAIVEMCNVYVANASEGEVC